MSTDPIFVLGLMRSGTTLVQRVLNCHRKVTIWGEHGGALRPLLTGPTPFEFDEHHRERIARGFERRSAVIGQLADANAFDAYVSPVPPEVYEGLVDDVVRAHITELFTTGLTDDVRWGFKETRYAGNVYQPLARVFPEGRFVFVSRSPQPWISSVVRARFRRDLRPDQLDDPQAVQVALGELVDLWLRRTSATVRFIDKSPERRLLIAHERFRTVEAAEILFDRLGVGRPSPKVLSSVLDSKAGSSDAAVDWHGDVRKQLEDQIATAVAARPEIFEIELRLAELSLS